MQGFFDFIDAKTAFEEVIKQKEIFNMQEKQKISVRKLTLIAMLGAIAGLLMFYEISVPFAPPFYKLDFSDVPSIIGTFIMGPLAGIYIEIVKILIKLLLKGTSTAFVGELVSIVGSILFIVVIDWVYKYGKKGIQSMYLSLVIGLLFRVIWACICNVYISLPMYAKIYGWPMEKLIAMGTAVNPKITDIHSFVIWAIIPFNLLKYSLVCVLVALLYRALEKIIYTVGEQVND